MSDSQTTSHDALVGRGLSPAEMARYRLGQVLIRPTSLWAQGRALALQLETEIFPVCQDENLDQLILVVTDAPSLEARFPAGLERELDEAYAELARFLSELGIEKLRLETRLESNQLTDIITLLWAFRKAVKRQRRRGLARRLGQQQGILFVCTQTSLVDGVLDIHYTYCMGALSRVLQWFKKASGHFQDHRALYRVAPRYAGLVAAIAVAHLVTFWLTDNWWVVLVATLIEAVTLFVLVYLVLMAVGSLEYDNEEKSYRLRRAYGQLQKYAQRIQGDLGRARTVQQQLLPNMSNMPLSDRLDWAASFEPESEIGGDYFDAHRLDETRVGVIFCDVSGHGMSAALVTAIIKTAFQGWVESREGLEGFAHRLNRRLCRDTPVDSFAAVFIAVYDVETRELTYTNCGHNPEPWILPADGADLVRLDDARGMIMGVDEEIFPVKVRGRRLQPGQCVVFTTDGVIEETSPEGDLFGRERLEQVLAELSGAEVRQITRRIAETAGAFAGETAQNDDCTILAMRVRP